MGFRWRCATIPTATNRTGLLAYVEFIVGHSGAVMAAVLTVTALAIAFACRVKTEFDFEASFPSAHPYVDLDRRVRSEFGGRNYVVVAVVPRQGDVWNPRVLRTVYDLTFDVLRLPAVIAANVVSLAAPNARYFEESETGEIFPKVLMREVPDGPEAMAQLRARVDSDPLFRGVVVSEDQRAALVFADFWERADRVEIFRMLERTAAAHRDSDIDVVFMGQPVVTNVLRSQVAALGLGFVPAVIAIALLLLASFRSVQGMLIPLLTALLSAIWGMGFQGAAGMPLDMWNALVPTLVVAVAAGHSAQMLKRYYEELERCGNNRDAVIASTVRIGPVMIAAGSTAALGFASLALFGIQSVRNFGLSAAAGIASAVVLEMTFVPALRSRLVARSRPARKRRTDFVLEWLARLGLARRGAWVFGPAAIALVTFLYGASLIETGTATRNYMARGSEALRYWDTVNAHFPGTVTFGVLLSGEPGTMTTAPAVRLMENVQRVLANDPRVLRTASLGDLLTAVYRAFEPGARSMPEDPSLVAQLAFLGSSPAFERFVDNSYSRAVVWAYLPDDDSTVTQRLIESVRRRLAEHPPPPGIRVELAAGTGPTMLALNEHLTEGKLVNMAAVFAVIFVVASIVLRAPLGGLYVTLPIAASVLLDFGTLGFTGKHLEMGTASIIAMGMGIGADYAIYVIYRLREELTRCGSPSEALRETLLTSGRAVLFVAASISGGFAALVPSAFPGLRTFGLMIPLTMLTSAFGAVFLLPALLAQTRPRFLRYPS